MPLPEGSVLLIAAGAVCGVAICSVAHADHLVVGDCMIEIGGHVVRDGACRINMFANGDGFEIEPDRTSDIFAYVNLELDHRSATASWNGLEHASHAQENLGTMTRQGGCWVNDRAKVCAWKPGTRPR